jgi:tetratricopeptide (TPR) repeat protein
VKLSRANIVAGVSVVAALASLSLTAFVLLQRGSGQVAAPTATATSTDPTSATAVSGSASMIVKAEVATAYAKLDIPVRTGELTVEKAARLRGAIKKEDFTTATQLAAAILAESQVQGWDYQPFRNLAEDYLDLLDPDFSRHLDNWVATKPQMPLPLLLRAQYHYRHGWRVRGPDFADKVSSADMRGFGAEMQQALEDVEMAIRLDGGDPFAHLLRLRILRGGGLSQRLFDAFGQAIARYPNYYMLYTIMLDTLQPKWGGTTAEMQAFVDHYAGPAPANSPLKLLYLELYSSYLQIAANSCWNNDKPQDCLAAIQPTLVTPELEAHMRDAMQLYDRLDSSPTGRYRFGLAIEPIFARLLSDRTADFYSGAALQLAATAMHSDTQLKQERPGHNDYMIDKLVARSWLQKGYYDNALTKAEDALKDVAATQFPGEAEKDQAMADIYVLMSEAYADVSQYPATIATAQAARELGYRSDEDHRDCFAFGKMKAYEAAIEACNAALARHPDNLTTYFWRARAYDALGRKDDALKDYALVAGSHHGFRADAAIDMSMIYFGRNDNQGALDLLNSYPYLYDPNLSAQNLVAVAYNNRCYAYMELGDLQKALADCRQSLKLGSIPDAFRKEQELLKRLGDQAPKTNL